MTKAAARELAPHKIRVNSVHPGLVDTAMLDEFGGPGVRDAIRERVPLGEEESTRLALVLAAVIHALDQASPA